MASADTQEPKFCFFFTLVEVEDTCICRNHSEITHDYLYKLVKRLAVYEIVIGVLGLVPTVFALFISLTIVRKRDDLEHNEKSDITNPEVSNSVKAFLMSAISAFNILRLFALLDLGVNTLLDSRRDVHKRTNLLWLFGTWGVAWFTVDLCLATWAEISRWGRIRKLFYRFQKTMHRAVAIFLTGMVLHGKTFAHIFIERSPHCDSCRYWWVYKRRFSLNVLMTLHFMLPALLLAILVIGLLVPVVQKRMGNLPHDTLLPECFIICLSAWHAASNLLATIYFLHLMPQHSPLSTGTVLHTEDAWLNTSVVSEIFCSLNAATSAFLFFLWPNFRAQLTQWNLY